MSTEDALAMVTAVFIIGMTWLRTRLQYRPARGETLVLQRAGRVYFACLLALLAVGWVAAPALGRSLWPAPAASATVLRVLWSMSAYFVFIVAHHALRARHAPLFVARPR